VIVNNYQTGINSSIEPLHEVSHSHKNNRAALKATKAERSPRNEDMHTRTHQQSRRARPNIRITIRNIGQKAHTWVQIFNRHSIGIHRTDVLTHTHQHTPFILFFLSTEPNKLTLIDDRHRW